MEGNLTKFVGTLTHDFSGAFNPARDLGPRLIALILFGSEAFSGVSYFFWIPLVAPLLGGVVGALTYLLLVSAHWPEA